MDIQDFSGLFQFYKIETGTPAIGQTAYKTEELKMALQSWLNNIGAKYIHVVPLQYNTAPTGGEHFQYIHILLYPWLSMDMWHWYINYASQTTAKEPRFFTRPKYNSIRPECSLQSWKKILRKSFL